MSLLATSEEVEAFSAGSEFVNIANPSDIRSLNNKRLIRANATAHSHSRRRQAASTDSPVPTKTNAASLTSKVQTRARQSRPYTVHKTRLDPWAAPSVYSTPRTALSQSKPTEVKSTPTQLKATKPATLNKGRRSDAQYQFLTWCDPADANSSRHRKQIRSHVARTSHPSIRAQAAAINKIEEASDDAAEPKQSSSSSEESPEEDVDCKPNIIETSQPHLLTSPCLGINRATYSQVIDKSDKALSDLINYNNAQHIGVVLEESGCNIKLVMDHYLFILYSQMYNLESQCGMSPESDNRIVFFTSFLLSDPALFLSIILMGVTHKLGHEGRKTHRAEILRLQMAVVGAVNYALNDTKRATSDAVIYSVANLACYDAIWGEPEEYAMHMTGLKKMVDLRGGLMELGVRGILQISLLWSDANCAHLLRTTPFFAEYDLPDPDIESFCSGLLKGEVYRNW